MIKVLKSVFVAVGLIIFAVLALWTYEALTETTVNGDRPDYGACLKLDDKYRRIIEAQGVGYSRGDARRLVAESRRVCAPEYYEKHKRFLCASGAC